MSVSDYIVLACALTKETKGLINKTCLEHAKQDSILINISRGPVIDEVALIDMLKLKKGPIVGAALDVFSHEPLPLTSPLWELDNVLLSPHNADKTVDFRHESIKFFTENCKRFLMGLPLESPVDLSRGY
jgi:phosphoglycerate dehydrogenase-like enzyme